MIKFLQNIKFKERGLNSNPPLAYALGSQFHNGFATVRRDNLYFTTLLWQNNGRQNGHISRTITHFEHDESLISNWFWCVISELYKTMVNKVTFLDFRVGELSVNFRYCYLFRRSTQNMSANRSSPTMSIVLPLSPVTVSQHYPPRSLRSIVVLRSEITSGICAKLRTVAASNNRVHMPWSLYYCLFAPHICMMLFFTHIPFVVNHTINATPPERLQQHSLLFTTNRTDRAFFVWRLNSVRPSHPGHSTILLTCLSLCNTHTRAVNLIHAVVCDDEGVTQARGC